MKRGWRERKRRLKTRLIPSFSLTCVSKRFNAASETSSRRSCFAGDYGAKRLKTRFAQTFSERSKTCAISNRVLSSESPSYRLRPRVCASASRLCGCGLSLLTARSSKQNDFVPAIGTLLLSEHYFYRHLNSRGLRVI